MFGTWLSRTAHPCWCHFVQALYIYAVRLCGIAEEAKAHLRICDSVSMPSTEAVKKI